MAAEKFWYYHSVTTMSSRNIANVKKLNSLDAGIQDSSTSISIVVKFEEMSELDGDESDKRR